MIHFDTKDVGRLIEFMHEEAVDAYDERQTWFKAVGDMLRSQSTEVRNNAITMENQRGELKQQAFLWGQDRDALRTATAEGASWQKRHDGQVTYSIALQRAIEYHCDGKIVPKVIADECPHHAKMMNARVSGSDPTG